MNFLPHLKQVACGAQLHGGKRHRFGIPAAAALAAICAFTSACRVGPKYVRPDLATAAPVSYKENQPGSPEAQAQGWKQANPQDAMIRGKWWEIFGDPELNSLEESLNIDDQNIKQYFENYMAARAVARNARASLFPTLSIEPSYSKSGSAGSSSQSTTGTTSTIGGSTYTTGIELPADVSWEPDLFGKVRNTLREYANAAQVSAANLANEQLSEQSSLAQYYFELRGEDALQQLYDNTSKAYTESLHLTEVLFRTGIDSEEDVAEAETNLREAEANAVAIGTTRAQYEHAIALLLGRPAGNFSIPVRPLDAKPPVIPTGIPSQLLERRPDIAAAERTVAEANALIGVGKAAYYPTVSLSFSGGTESSSFSNLLSYSSLFWSLGASASETVLDFGARQATVREYEAQYRADVAAYRQTVLNAFKEVEDYLVSDRRLAEQIQRQELAVKAAQRYEAIATKRYKTGIDTYLNVLTAQNDVLSTQQTLATLKASQMTAAVQLVAALGGGWDTGSLPGEKEVARK
jgi:NodT family efflux transporter outer membrane factor (OMF) lipoprotein